VPMISGQSAKYIVAALNAYKKGERKHPTMRGIAASLTDADMADLAAYYEKHVPAGSQPAPDEPVRSPADVAALLMLRLGYLDQEQLVTVCLDARRCVQEVALIYRGTVSQALVRVAEIFRPAVRLNSSAIILAHNHPTGSLKPSEADIELTGCCAQAG